MTVCARLGRPCVLLLLAAFLNLLLVGAAAGEALELAPVTRPDQHLLQQITSERKAVDNHPPSSMRSGSGVLCIATVPGCGWVRPFGVNRKRYQALR